MYIMLLFNNNHFSVMTRIENRSVKYLRIFKLECNISGNSPKNKQLHSQIQRGSIYPHSQHTMALSQKRLFKEIAKFREQNPAQMSISEPDLQKNCNLIIATLKGPRQTMWENNEYKLEMKFKDSYPINAPEVKFITPIFHPNVYSDGRICLDILSNQWSPIYSIEAILTSIRSLLCDPNPNSPANSEAASLWKSDMQQFTQRNVQKKAEEQPK